MIGRHLTHIPLFSGMLKLKRRAHIHVVLYTAFNLCCKSRIFRIVVGRRIYFFFVDATQTHTILWTIYEYNSFQFVLMLIFC